MLKIISRKGNLINSLKIYNIQNVSSFHISTNLFKEASIVKENKDAGNIAKNENSDKYWENPVAHPIYTSEELNTVEKTHHDAKKIHEKLAYNTVKLFRKGFDYVSNYKGPGQMEKKEWLARCIFLETIAGVPGMVGGMARHLRSLRTMKRDNGWIHTLLEEAENERMHLLIFMNLREHPWWLKYLVLVGQGVFFNLFFLTYLVHPKTCHRFVGYLEEEAVKTYTSLLQDINDGNMKAWKSEIAPLIARNYYKLPDNATMEDMIKCIRADEANHRDVNHTFAGLDQKHDTNPFILKEKKINNKKALL